MVFSKELIPYNKLTSLIDTTTDTPAPYTMTDCTGEFHELSSERYGGNIFGENAVAEWSPAHGSGEPIIYFRDRLLRQGQHNTPVVAARLGSAGLMIDNPVVFADWLSSREVRKDGTMAHKGIRESAKEAGLALSPDVDMNEIVTETARARVEAAIAQRLFIAPEYRISLKEGTMAEIVDDLQHLGLPDTADIAEVFATENRAEPHVLRTPGRTQAVPVLESKGYIEKSLLCQSTGVLVTVASSDLVRAEGFFAGDLYRDRTVDDVEEKFGGITSPRILTAVGRPFTVDERRMLTSKGQAHSQLGESNPLIGRSVPYYIRRRTLPRGRLVRDGSSTRVFVTD